MITLKNYIKGGNLYDSSNSSSLIKNDTRDFLQYGTGKVYGITNLETVQIGDLVVENQNFIEAVSLNGLFFINSYLLPLYND